MPFIAVGVDHRTAPLRVRERVALERDAAFDVSRALLQTPSIHEAVVLSTCNRTELYLYTDEEQNAIEVAMLLLIRGDESLRRHVTVRHEMEVATHLFRVASGLESQVPGESQILSQVREALDGAQCAGSVQANLHALFRSAISCARQARAGTTLGRIDLSIGLEAVQRAEAELGLLEGRAALVIGGGEISKLVVKHLHERRVRIWIANRTRSVAEEIAAVHDATAAQLTDIPRLLRVVDMVFSATAAPHYVIDMTDVPVQALEARVTPLAMFDLAIPRDIDPAVASVPGVELHDLDTLLPTGEDERWSDDIRTMEAVVAAEVQEFTTWYLTRRVAPVIAHLRRHVEAVAQVERKRVQPQLKDLSERQQAAVESLSSRLIDKMFHHLVMRLRLAAQTDPALVDAAEFFFLHGDGGLFEYEADTHTEQPLETPTS